MPHFTIEYSANLDARVDMAEIVEIVRKAAVETGNPASTSIRRTTVRASNSRSATSRAALAWVP